MPQRSMALDLGSIPFGGLCSNPTAVQFGCFNAGAECNKSCLNPKLADSMTVMPQSGHMREIGTSHNSKLVDLNLRFGLKTVALLSMNTNTHREKLAYIYSAGLPLCYIRAVCLLCFGTQQNCQC